ncbi:MAG: stage V sporulation protein T [Acutalibacteraceae bacterium]|nr:stage V sporulation protein T [Acutalibacteraceae bacterium]
MKATEIARRIDNLARIVIPKKIIRTLHICGRALHTTLTIFE